MNAFNLSFCVSNNGKLHVLTMYPDSQTYKYSVFSTKDELLNVDNTNLRFLEFIGDMQGLENDLCRGGYKYVH